MKWLNNLHKLKLEKKRRKNITNAIAHVNSSFNNTLITITDYQGNTVAWSSAGSMGFKGSREINSICSTISSRGRREKKHQNMV